MTNQKIKREIIRDLEKLGSTDPKLKIALNPLLGALQRDSSDDYASSAPTLAQLADSYEMFGLAGAPTIRLLRKIAKKLKML